MRMFEYVIVLSSIVIGLPGTHLMEGLASRHGENGREFRLLVDAGMSPAQAIQAATANAADLVGRNAGIGSIEPGKDADILVVGGSPLQDVTELERVQFVMRRGVVHRLGGERQAFNPR